MNGFDLSTVTNIYLGSTPVKEVYIGAKLIWPTGAFDYANEYFTIESLEDGNQIGIVEQGRPSISISTDKQTWTTVTPDATPTYFITLNAGEKVYIKGSNNAYGDPWSEQDYFTSTGKFNVSGNIMSLLYEDDFQNQTTLSESAFRRLFANANKLVSAEHLVLPATTLNGYCYGHMFLGCTSLTKVPKLPATNLSNMCYEHMFEKCTSLTTAPELPATTLEWFCYAYMFQDCTSLTKAPELPVTTLVDYCYEHMFWGCTSLTTAPELPATTLVDYCYGWMFLGCTSLNYIKMLATDNISAYNCLAEWVDGVAPSGTFVKDASTTLPTGISGIPEGWTIENFNDYSKDYLTIESLEDGTFTFTQNDMEYSLDNGTTWTTLAANTASPTVTAGNKIMWKQTGLTPDSNNGIGTFTSTGKFNVSGNIMSLLYADDFQNQTTLESSSTFRKLFANANKLVSAEHLVLPATTLTYRCYNEMFTGCTSLTTAPELPATTLANNCYDCMLYGCRSLTTAPKLPATTLANSCYFYMLSGCSSLATAPKLPATTLAEYCYEGIFENCTSLTKAPELPATTLVDYCYANMFIGCTSLTTAPELPATTLANGCYVGMFQGCTGLTSAPILPATTLAQSCYANMFKGCTKLESINCWAKDISATSCTYNWLNNVASYGVFFRDTNMHDWPTGPSGIPDGWEVLTT